MSREGKILSMLLLFVMILTSALYFRTMNNFIMDTSGMIIDNSFKNYFNFVKSDYLNILISSKLIIFLLTGIILYIFISFKKIDNLKTREILSNIYSFIVCFFVLGTLIIYLSQGLFPKTLVFEKIDTKTINVKILKEHIPTVKKTNTINYTEKSNYPLNLTNSIVKYPVPYNLVNPSKMKYFLIKNSVLLCDNKSNQKYVFNRKINNNYLMKLKEEYPDFKFEFKDDTVYKVDVVRGEFLIKKDFKELDETVFIDKEYIDTEKILKSNPEIVKVLNIEIDSDKIKKDLELQKKEIKTYEIKDYNYNETFNEYEVEILKNDKPTTIYLTSGSINNTTKTIYEYNKEYYSSESDLIKNMNERIINKYEKLKKKVEEEILE